MADYDDHSYCEVCRKHDRWGCWCNRDDDMLIELGRYDCQDPAHGGYAGEVTDAKRAAGRG